MIEKIHMAYDTYTLEVLHGLTPEGEEHYHQMLEEKADEILFKHEHPLKWAVKTIVEKFS